MKTSRRIKNTLGLGFVLTLALVFGSAAGAQTQSPTAQNPNAPAPKRTDSPAPTCGKCRTEPHEEFAVTKVGDEYVSRTTAIGTKHTCATCGGRITTVRGETRKAMMDYCPICAKARRTCCTTEAGHNVPAT